MLVTEVTSLDIVIGVLAARPLPVLGGVGCVVPVLGLAFTLGGIPPWTMVDLVAVTTGTAALGCTLALALSIGGGGCTRCSWPPMSCWRGGPSGTRSC